jgi:arabinogalactan oligomer/maltooligosaccharide transport system permease protein
VFLIFFTFMTITPILVVVGTAFGEFPAMALANTPLLRDVLMRGQPLPGWTLDHFHRILFESQFSRWLWNSVLVSGGTTAVGLLLATTGAYGFSRFMFRGKRWSMLSFVVVQMFPGAIILIPYYVLMYQLGLINQLLGLVIMYSVTALPFVLWFLKGFFDTIPVDLEEAAMVDGTTRTGALWRIIVPLATPAIAVAALFSFLSAWNEWLLAFTFMTSSANYTLPVGVSSFINPPQVDWNSFAAISILISLPVAVLFLVFQKYLVSGLTKGAVKG